MLGEHEAGGVESSGTGDPGEEGRGADVSLESCRSPAEVLLDQ